MASDESGADDASSPSRPLASSLEYIPGGKGKERRGKPVTISECPSSATPKLDRA